MKRLSLDMGTDPTSRAKLRAMSGLDAMFDRDAISFLARNAGMRLRKMKEHKRAVELERFQKLLAETLEQGG